MDALDGDPAVQNSVMREINRTATAGSDFPIYGVAITERGYRFNGRFHEGKVLSCCFRGWREAGSHRRGGMGKGFARSEICGFPRLGQSCRA